MSWRSEARDRARDWENETLWRGRSRSGLQCESEGRGVSAANRVLLSNQTFSFSFSVCVCVCVCSCAASMSTKEMTMGKKPTTQTTATASLTKSSREACSLTSPAKCASKSRRSADQYPDNRSRSCSCLNTCIRFHLLMCYSASLFVNKVFLKGQFTQKYKINSHFTSAFCTPKYKKNIWRSFAKTDNSVFNYSQKACFFVLSNESPSNCRWVLIRLWLQKTNTTQ